MKLFRFMSYEEFEKYYNNKELINTTNHNKDNSKKTNSMGFCFFNFAEYKPEEMFHSVFGIVDCSICCIFETDRKNVRRTYGRYSQAINKNSLQRRTIIAHEYCTTEYDKNKFKLLEWAIPDWFNWNKWEWKEGKEIGK